MCGTAYNPDVPLAEQLEQLLHNITTWTDTIQVIDAQIGSDTLIKRATKSELWKAASALKLAREDVLGALRKYLANTRQEG